MLQQCLGRRRLQRPTRQTGEHLLQASPGHQEEEKEHGLSGHPFLKGRRAALALPDAPSHMPEKRVNGYKTPRAVSRETGLMPRASWALWTYHLLKSSQSPQEPSTHPHEGMIRALQKLSSFPKVIYVTSD